MRKAIDTIENDSDSYFLLARDHKSRPVYIGNHDALRWALSGINDSMIIATTGNKYRAIVIVDFTSAEVLILQKRVEWALKKIKAN